ncbi:MAG: penicillin-binding transpeptidase domain-containing protein [Armatimonadota bacterium]
MRDLVSLLLGAPVPKTETTDLSRYFNGYRGAFVLHDVAGNLTIRCNPAQCAKQVFPCSTFKIPNSLIFLEKEILRDQNQREKWDGTKWPVDEWNRDQTLKSAYADSCVWFYKRLAAKVSPEVTRRYIQALRYGNEKVPADFSDGLPHYWLDGPLLISPDEQIAFLTRLQRGDVPFSPRTQRIVRQIMVQQKTGGTVLRGKTGTDGNWNTGITTLGWYVGYLEKKNKPYIFAANIVGGKNPSGRKAREIVLRILKDQRLLS